MKEAEAGVEAATYVTFEQRDLPITTTTPNIVQRLNAPTLTTLCALVGISKCDGPYVRTLLVHGARSVMYHSKVPGAWQKAIQERRPANNVVIALANRMA